MHCPNLTLGTYRTSIGRCFHRFDEREVWLPFGIGAAVDEPQLRGRRIEAASVADECGRPFLRGLPFPYLILPLGLRYTLYLCKMTSEKDIIN